MRSLVFSFSLVVCLAVWGKAQDPATPAVVGDPVDQVRYERLVRLGVSYLLDKGQDAEDGSFSKQLGPAVTALSATALMKHGLSPDHPRVAQALQYLLSFRRDDGGFYPQDSVLQSYETSIAILCLTEANRDGRYDELIRDAANYLRTLQWDQAEGHDRTSTFFGGVGYGNHKRPDLSNTHFWIEAMIAAGEDPESTAMQNARLFVARCQNLVGPDHLAEYAQLATADDRGGFIYSAVGEGESKASTSESGGLRSYASMTYAGLKSFLYAGVGREDIRVRAALDWIRRHYDLSSNPGMDQQGLYYYYHVFAKALGVLGEETLVDAAGQAHNWRSDLVRELERRQQPDGSWVNTADRWYEGDANLVTAYALLALAHCQP